MHEPDQRIRRSSNGHTVHPDTLGYLTSRLATCEQYAEALKERQAELNSELAALKKRSKELAKKLER
jgi:predicted transcriptional regulator